MTEPKHSEIRLHHIGFVVSNIHKEIKQFARSIGASENSRIYHDPLQKVRVSFLQTKCPRDAQIELVEPAAPDSPVLNFLNKGGGLHHLCYEVTDLDAHLSKMRKGGAVIVKPPLPAVAFENRRIGWVFTRQKLLLEFLEEGKV
jgi:methylmalonyl-CoA/ethylmalonyl-CoA epimerase